MVRTTGHIQPWQSRHASLLGSKPLNMNPISSEQQVQQPSHELSALWIKESDPLIAEIAEELRIWYEHGTFRVIYLARLPDAVYVLHAFQKKTQATAQRDIDLAKKRYNDLMSKQP